jgi:hypothetical protein
MLCSYLWRLSCISGRFEAHMKTSLLLFLFLVICVSAQSQVALPKRILVQSKWYSIYVSPDAPENMAMKWGTCNCEAAYIQIDPGQTEAEKRDTLWHEINHALNDCDTQFWKYVDYDNLFSDMIPAQLQVLRDNPGLVRFLVADAGSKGTKAVKPGVVVTPETRSQARDRSTGNH